MKFDRGELNTSAAWQYPRRPARRFPKQCRRGSFSPAFGRHIAVRFVGNGHEDAASMGRGKECGRDAVGRRIPRRNTKSGQIYTLKLAGMSNVEIARKLGMTASEVGVLWHGIRYPERKNKRWYAWRLANAQSRTTQLRHRPSQRRAIVMSIGSLCPAA
jgi:hypothetical protein